MIFAAWVDEKRGKTSRTQFLRDFASKAGLSVQTLRNVIKGGRLSLYDNAKRLSDATKGEVSIPDLCE